MSVHTPRPWNVDTTGKSIFVLPMCEMLRLNGNAPCLANARLIAAAPEMLDALEALLKESVAISKHICNDCCVPYTPCKTEIDAENAIKKARGI